MPGLILHSYQQGFVLHLSTFFFSTSVIQLINPMKKLFLFILILVFENLCDAGEFQLGLMLGANYSSYQWNTSTAGASFATTGYSGSGGLLLSFFQNHRIGFRITGLDNYISSTGSGSGSVSSQTATITGTVPAAAATLAFNFDAGPGRHSIGVGYGYESFGSLSCSGTSTFPTSTSGAGLVVDIKEVMKSGLFGYAEGFLPVDNLSAFSAISTVFVGVGYDFGSSK
jgi:hypothetical protein